MAAKTASTPALPRYVELIRVSSAGQAERDTPADQRRALDRLAASRPGVLVERIEHGAFGLSGAADLDDRPDLQRLAELSRARAYDELRVRHLDRLTRHADPEVRFAIYGMVQRAGAVIVDASGGLIDPADPSGSGEVSYFLQTWMSAQEKRRILERTKEGRRRKLAAGEIIACVPWARRFDKATRTWTVDERAAELYRRLFSEILDGVTAGRLAEKLNDEGHVTPRGGRWSPRAICDLIHSTSAVGRIEQAGATIACPPIVDEQTWEAARAQLARNNATQNGRRATRGSIEALLRGLATCGNCGSTMYVNKGGQKGRESVYYVCGAVLRDRGRADSACHGWHRAHDIDALVRAELEQFLAHPDRLLAAAAPRRGSNITDNKKDIAAAERELERLVARQENLLRYASKGLAPEDVMERQLVEIQRQRAAAEKQLAAARSARDAAERVAANRRTVEEAVALLRSLVKNGSFDAYRRLAQALFPRGEDTWIKIHNDGTVDARGLVTLRPVDAANEVQPDDQRRIERAITIRCTSLVPSPISVSFASRKYRSTGKSRVYP
jgi:DNA invertase Pin-like site-specific DNA recombinase